MGGATLNRDIVNSFNWCTFVVDGVSDYSALFSNFNWINKSWCTLSVNSNPKESCTGCPTWVVPHGWTCISYTTGSSNSCNSYKKTSTCSDGVWNIAPGNYSSCSAPSTPPTTPTPSSCSSSSCPTLSSVPSNATLYLPNLLGTNYVWGCTVKNGECFSIVSSPWDSYNCTYTNTNFPSSLPSSCTSLNLDSLTSINSTQWNAIRYSNVTTLSIAWMTSLDSTAWNAIRYSNITTLNIPWVTSLNSTAWNAIRYSNITTLNIPWVTSMDSTAWNSIRYSNLTSLTLPCITSMDSTAWNAIRYSNITTLSLPWVTSMDSIAWNSIRYSNLTSLSLPWVTSMDSIAWNEIRYSKLYALTIWLTSYPSSTYVSPRCSSHT